MVFHGVEQVEQAVREEGHNFIFLYLGHYCNWEWVASLPYTISPSIHCAQIYHPLYNKAVDRFFFEIEKPVRWGMYSDEKYIEACD